MVIVTSAGGSPVGAVTFVPVVVGAGAMSATSAASAVTISWRVAAPSVSPSIEKVAVMLRVARRSGIGRAIRCTTAVG